MNRLDAAGSLQRLALHQHASARGRGRPPLRRG